ASKGPATTFFAALHGGPVYHWSPGAAWARLGTGFPVDPDVGRVGLAVQPGNPDVVYALVARASAHLRGLYRYDARDGQWRLLRGLPPDLFGPGNRPGQGDYDLAVAVAPDP